MGRSHKIGHVVREYSVEDLMNKHGMLPEDEEQAAR